MRLLKREKSGWLPGTYTFSLTKFDSWNTPPEYVILSHRWGPDEVVYQDIENRTAKAKAGYKKLEFCAEQAARDGLIYFWIETCCIDKTNSVELAEAINSMFKWYHTASKCYVYLSDVPAHHSTSSTTSVQDKWEIAFQNSEWFTRGWTLQELIAPKDVDFFSTEGIKLGSKRSLERQICQITGVPVSILRGKSLSEIDEAERFSWTLRRETTIDEDAIYCLLGLFDVHMPLIYGEGRQKALARLRREIQQSSASVSFVVADAPWIVPFERNPYFTGRNSELNELEEKLFTKCHASRIAITGLGGVGKTQLVLELLYRIREKHKDCSIMWIPAMTTASLQQGYLKIAQQLDIPGYEDDKADIKKLIQTHLSKEDTSPWLLVFDNADDVAMWTTTSMPVSEDANKTTRRSLTESCRLIDHLPKNKQGCVIFTTRDRKAAVKLAQQNIIKVSEMSEEVAAQLLKKSLANAEFANNSQELLALLSALTYLPLAISQATAYINANEITLAEYLSLLEKREEEAIEVLSEDFEDHGRYQNTKNPVATTWLISFEQIQHSEPLAAEYLSFIACIHSRDIPESLLPPGPSRKRELEAIGALSAYSFVSRRPVESSLDLHRLVHLATRNWLRREGLLAQWTERAILRLEEVFPNEEDENRATWRTYLPHTRQVLASDLVKGSEQQRLALMRRYGRCLHNDGQWNEAEIIFTKLISMERLWLGEDDQSSLTSMSWLASIFKYQGRWKEAEKLQMQVLEIRKQKLGSDHMFTVTTMANLALTYQDQGRLHEAEQLKVQVLEARTMQFGADHFHTLVSMAHLASTYEKQGRLKEAEQLQTKVVECQKTKLGVNNLKTITSMANLAQIYYHQDRLCEAEQLQLQVLECQKTELGADHPDTLTVMSHLAMTYHEQGRLSEAESLQVLVIESRKAKLGANHPDTLVSTASLASTYYRQGRISEAEQLELQVLGYQKTKLGADHPNTLTTAANLATTYYRQGRLSEAESLELQVLEARKVKLGADHPDTVGSMQALAYTWMGLARTTQAIQLTRDCVQRQVRTLGATHPDTLASQKVLARWEAECSATSTGDATGVQDATEGEDADEGRDTTEEEDVIT